VLASSERQPEASE